MGNVLIATDWLAACAGCHMSLLDLDERLVELLYHVTFTSSPVTDLKHPPESGVTVGILTGAISNTHNIEVARRMRSRCTYLIAVGDCATFGGIVAARNLVGTPAALTARLPGDRKHRRRANPGLAGTGPAARHRHGHRRRGEGGHLSAGVPAPARGFPLRVCGSALGPAPRGAAAGEFKVRLKR